METEQEIAPKLNFWLGFGAISSAIGASTCCVGPLLFITLGVSGAWMSTLTSMIVARPYFFMLSMVFISLAFYRLYLIPESCEPDQDCAFIEVVQKQRLIFWVGSGVVFLLLAFPWYFPLFL